MRKRVGWWRGYLLLGVAAVLVAAPCGSMDGERGSERMLPGTLEAEVVEVTDGDTIEVELVGGGRERVRYIGIDTPESNPDQPLECFGPEAAEANRELVEDRRVRLQPGPEQRDRYGRLLAFVRVGDTLVNAELVRRGYARTLTIAPNDVLAPTLQQLERQAARAGRGLWDACSK